MPDNHIKLITHGRTAVSGLHMQLTVEINDSKYDQSDILAVLYKEYTEYCIFISGCQDFFIRF
jgi:hypothetical protein